MNEQLRSEKPQQPRRGRLYSRIACAGGLVLSGCALASPQVRTLSPDALAIPGCRTTVTTSEGVNVRKGPFVDPVDGQVIQTLGLNTPLDMAFMIGTVPPTDPQTDVDPDSRSDTWLKFKALDDSDVFISSTTVAEVDCGDLALLDNY